MWIAKSGVNILLTLCTMTGHLESMDGSSFCCGPKLGGSCHHRFRDHPTSRRCWFEGPLLGGEGMLPVSGWGCAAGFDGSFIVHSCPTFHDWCWVLAMEEWHFPHRASHRWDGLRWVQRDLSHGFSHFGGMHPFLVLSFLFVFSCTQ